MAENTPLTRDELDMAMQIQSMLFSPTTPVTDVTDTILHFVLGRKEGKILVVLHMIRDLLEVQPYKAAELRSIVLDTLKQCSEWLRIGLTNFRLHEMSSALKLSDTTSALSTKDLCFDQTSERECNGFFEAVLRDDPEQMVTEFNKNRQTLERGACIFLHPCHVIDMCVRFRALRCIDALRNMGYDFCDSGRMFAIGSFTEEEFLRFFKVPSHNASSYTNFMKFAIKARSLWVAKEHDDLYWELINNYNVLIEVNELDPYAPTNVAHYIRPAFGFRFNRKQYEHYAAIADEVFEESLDIEFGDDPVVTLILAEACMRRIHSFDKIVEIIQKRLDGSMIRNFSQLYPTVTFFLLTKQPSLIDSITEKLFQFVPFLPSDRLSDLEKKMDMEEWASKYTSEGYENLKADSFRRVIEFEHPGFIPSLNFCVYKDNLPCFINAYENFSQEEFKKKYAVNSLIDIVASMGSIRCFQYLVENGVIIGEKTVYSAVEGGNLEIMTRCISSNFNNAMLPTLLGTVFRYRRISLYTWLTENNDTYANVKFNRVSLAVFPPYHLFCKHYNFRVGLYNLRGFNVLNGVYYSLIDSFFRGEIDFESDH